MAKATKAEIEATVRAMEKENRRLQAALSDAVSVTAYAHLTRTARQGGQAVTVWTQAFQAALDAHEIVRIPARATPYYIDGTLIVPSHRRIEAEDGAVIRQMEGVKVLLLRNARTRDGTHAPIRAEDPDDNIAICGGRWEESYRARSGYGMSGLFDEARSYYGVSACFFFNHVRHLTLERLHFAHTAAFAIQMGDVRDAVVDDVAFTSCYADGVHVNGNTSCLLARNLRGQVGDDLLALNMYDWQDSSVDFGPTDMVLAENLRLSADSPYKALRICIGMYTYDDGARVDCALTNAVIRDVQGIHTFKLYYQTPPYKIAAHNPESGGVGSGDNLYFERIAIDLDSPVDRLSPYMESDPVRGHFAAFEIGANIGTLSLEDIRLTLHREVYPLSYLVAVGPKSVQVGEEEVFDPYVSARLDRLILSRIVINGEPVTEFAGYLKETAFADLYGDGFSSGRGEIGAVVVEG